MGLIRLCFKYNLPSPHSIILDPQPIDKWKITVKKSVTVYWKEKLQLEASSKSTLGLLSITNNENLKKASSLVPLNTNAVAKHRLQMRILSGTFTFQSERARFYGEDPTCTICGDAEEDATHCLSDCSAISHIRDPHLKKISSLLPPEFGPTSSKETALLIIAPSNFTNNKEIHQLCRNLCNKIITWRQGAINHNLNNPPLPSLAGNIPSLHFPPISVHLPVLPPSIPTPHPPLLRLKPPPL